jgi:hypothetical protein
MRSGRRRFLEVVGAGAAGASLPAGLGSCDGDVPPAPPAPGRFLTSAEIVALEAAANVVLPGELGTSAADLGVAAYVDRLLSAFDDDPPSIWGGGPYSGRHPFAGDGTGEPSDRFPDHAFQRSIPLDPARELAWRIRLFGSAETPGGAFNDPVLGPVVGWRTLYRRGLAALDEGAGRRGAMRFADLDVDGRTAVLGQVRRADEAFGEVFVAHVVEAAYGPPEYGGNRDLAGWRAASFDGDSMPLGYALPTASGGFAELDDRPTSAPNPGETYGDIDAEVLDVLRLVVLVAGGSEL